MHRRVAAEHNAKALGIVHMGRDLRISCLAFGQARHQCLQTHPAYIKHEIKTFMSLLSTCIPDLFVYLGRKLLISWASVYICYGPHFIYIRKFGDITDTYDVCVAS